jgi:hypothetical protein
MPSEGSDHPKEEKQYQCEDNGDQHGAGATEPVGEKEEHGPFVASLLVDSALRLAAAGLKHISLLRCSAVG